MEGQNIRDAKLVSAKQWLDNQPPCVCGSVPVGWELRFATAELQGRLEAHGPCTALTDAAPSPSHLLHSSCGPGRGCTEH